MNIIYQRHKTIRDAAFNDEEEKENTKDSESVINLEGLGIQLPKIIPQKTKTKINPKMKIFKQKTIKHNRVIFNAKPKMSKFNQN